MDAGRESFESALQVALADAGRWRLPIHKKWAPELGYGRHAGRIDPSARHAAVLALLYPGAGEGFHPQSLSMPAIVRPAHMGTHAGQVALPGGVRESGESLVECALREYAEELGGGTAPRATVIGKLPRVFVFNSNFVITPIVATTDCRPEYIPCNYEVDRVLQVPAFAPLGEHAQESLVIRRRGLEFSAPCFSAEGVAVWGATCLILAELAGCLARVKAMLPR